MRNRILLAAALAGAGGLAACGGPVNEPSLSKAAQIDAQPGDVILLKTSSNGGSTDLAEGELTAMNADGAVRPLKLADAAGREYKVKEVYYDSVDTQIGVFRFDDQVFAYRKADGTLVHLNHVPRVTRSTALYGTRDAGSPHVYFAGMSYNGGGDALLSYDKSAILAAAAGSSVSPAVVFRESDMGFSLTPSVMPPGMLSGFVDETGDQIYVQTGGVGRLNGGSYGPGNTFFYLGADTVYIDQSAFPWAQCAGAADIQEVSLGVLAASHGTSTFTGLLVTRSSSDPTCNPETDATRAFWGPSRRIFGWNMQDYPKAGAESVAYEIVGNTVVKHPHLSTALAANFPPVYGQDLSGSIDFDCTSDACAVAMPIPRNTISVFGIDDAQDLFVKDIAPPVLFENMRAMPASGDFVLQGHDGIVRAHVQGGALVYSPQPVINGEFTATPVN